MKQKTCFIIGAGSFSGMSIRPEQGDLIIAADGGYNYLKELGIEPDVLMGDFDSLDLIPEHRDLIRHSPLKDDTDMALAVAFAAEEGCRRFFLYGGLGGSRFDHTLANLQLLNGMSRQGLEAYLIGERVILTAITAERICFSEKACGMISVFCFGEPAAGVTECGLKYELEDAAMTCDVTLGVSNEFTGRPSFIETGTGTLIILWDEKNGLPVRRISFSDEETDVRALVSEFGWRSMHAEGDSLEVSDKLIKHDDNTSMEQETDG